MRSEVVLQAPLRLYWRLVLRLHRVRRRVKVGRALGLVPRVRRVQIQVILRVVKNLKYWRESQNCNIC